MTAAPSSSTLSQNSAQDQPSGPDDRPGEHLYLTARDGVLLQGHRWLPEQRNANAALIFLHGIASHGAWFAETAAFLAEHGIAVYAPDRRGSGLSGGPRGHIARYGQAVSGGRSSWSARAGPPSWPSPSPPVSRIGWPG